MPKVSIIVPVYKTEKYLDDCVTSILAQTMGDFELILVDDGSPDRCGALCDEYAARDARARVIHQENCGPARAWNNGYRSSKGDYVAFIDGDDSIYPEFLERLVFAAEQQDADIAVCGFAYTDEKNQPFGEVVRFESAEMSGEELMRKQLSHERGIGYIWNAVYKNGLFDEVFTEPFLLYEDTFIMYRVYRKAAKAVLIDDVLHKYRQRAGAITNNVNPTAIMDHIFAIRSRIDFMLGHALTEYLPKELESFWSLFYTNLRIFANPENGLREYAGRCLGYLKKMLLLLLRLADYPTAEKLRMIVLAYAPRALYQYQREKYGQ